MKKYNKYERLGMSLEAFGITVTTCGIAELSRWILFSGVIISGMGRALTMFFKSE